MRATLRAAAVSVLYREPKLLKGEDHIVRAQALGSFSALP